MTHEIDQLLDRLEELRAAATPGPWQVDSNGCCILGHAEPVTHAHFVTNRSTDPTDTALIVAAVNALPEFVAAIRGVLADHREIHPDDHYCAYDGFVWPCPTYRAVAAALPDGTPR